jgi:hypothetical protein
MSRPRSVSRGSPERKPGQPGRPRKKGKRLPTLAHSLGDGATTWTALTIARWYGQGERQIEMATSTAVWYHSGMEPVPLRWVLDPRPPGQVRAAGIALHRPGSAPTRKPRRNRLSPSLSHAGRWKPRFSRCERIWAWRRNGSGTIMQRSSHCAHDARLAGLVLAGDAAGSPAHGEGAVKAGGLVHQRETDLLGRFGPGAAASVAAAFLHVAGHMSLGKGDMQKRRHTETVGRLARASDRGTDRGTLLCCLMDKV